MLVLALLTSCECGSKERVNCYAYSVFLYEQEKAINNLQFSDPNIRAKLKDCEFVLENKPSMCSDQENNNKKEYLLRRIDFIKQNL